MTKFISNLDSWQIFAILTIAWLHVGISGSGYGLIFAVLIYFAWIYSLGFESNRALPKIYKKNTSRFLAAITYPTFHHAWALTQLNRKHIVRGENSAVNGSTSNLLNPLIPHFGY
jgi:hypothetical protein